MEDLENELRNWAAQANQEWYLPAAGFERRIFGDSVVLTSLKTRIQSIP